MLHGALAAGAFVLLRRGDVEGWLLAGLLLAKHAYEQIHGAMRFSGDMPVIVDAHLYGTLGGLAAAILLDLFPKSSSRARGWRWRGAGAAPASGAARAGEGSPGRRE